MARLRRRLAETADEITQEIRKPVVRGEKGERFGFSSGSTLLNLALTDHADFGFLPGKLVNIIGDSSAGKSFLLWTLFAELAHDPRFDEYDLIYDEPEVSIEFDIPKLFGGKTEERVRTDILSDTMEDFHDNLIKEVSKGKPIIYGLDSFDALTSEAEKKRDVHDGTYGGEKPKMSSEILRKVIGRISKTNSAVFIVSQTRDNIGVKFGSKKTRSGGRALKFYSTHEIWLAIEGHIKRKDREVGVDVIAKVSKNKVTGKLRTVGFPILYDYGVDDLVSMVNWLIDEKYWNRVKGKPGDTGKIDSNGFCEHDFMENLVNHIVAENLVADLKKVVEGHWLEIEESIATVRPPRYE